MNIKVKWKTSNQQTSKLTNIYPTQGVIQAPKIIQMYNKSSPTNYPSIQDKEQ